MKNLKKYTAIIVFTLTILHPANMFSDTLRIASDEWCPYDCRPEQNDGKIGYANELLVEAMKVRGHKVEFVKINFGRGLELVREGKLDASMAIFKEDAPDFVFNDFPLGKSDSTFFSHKDSFWKYTGIDSLKKARMIGVIDGYDYGDPTVMEYINKKPKNVLVITGEKPLERLIEMLINGRITAVIEDRSVMNYKVVQMEKADLVKISGTTEIEIDIFCGFSPQKKRSKEYAKILSEETTKMRKDGRLQKLLDKYGIKDWSSK